jgi:hypothetical protein
MFFRDAEGFTYIDVRDKGSLKRLNPGPYGKYVPSVVPQVVGMIHRLTWAAYDSFFDYRVFEYVTLFRAFSPYENLNHFQQYMLEIALNGEYELDDILSLLQVCAVKPKISLNLK